MMRATGRYADGWFPGTTRADEYGEQLSLVRTAASDAGRDPMDITPALIRFIVTGRSRDEIAEVVESDIAKIFTLNCDGEAWARHGAEHPLGSDFTGSQDLIPQLIDEQTALGYAAKVPRTLVEELFVVGTPDDVIEQIAEFRDRGMRHVVVGNIGAIQPSLRKSAATTAPYIKVVRGLRKL
jgi:phthiodiolone/phenolphthiodiolone dimycocerosates ketoreductase